MEKRIVIWAITGVLFLIALYLVFQAGSSGANVSTGSASGAIDTTGWSENEVMNYEMHGIIPARASASGSASAGSSGGMVGGC